MNKSFKKYVLTGTGTEIPNFNINDSYEDYLVTGSAIAIGNYAISVSGTPKLGSSFKIYWDASLNIITNGVNFSVLGTAIDQNQLQSKTVIDSYWNGSSWTVNIVGSFDEDIVETKNIVDLAVTTAKIDNLAVTDAKIANATITNGKIANSTIVGSQKLVDSSVTNIKLATMASLTFKANVTGGSTNPQDVPLSSLGSYTTGFWSLTGNSGTSAGTDFLGTIDGQPLVFKVNNNEAGRIDYSTGNTSLGYLAHTSITSGAFNTAIGWQALKINTSGSSNTAIGGGTLFLNTTGLNNTAIGYSSAALCTSGSHNTGVGYGSLPALTTGSYNTSVGEQSAVNLTTGSSNTTIGYNAIVDSATASNRIALGANATADADNQFALPTTVTKVKWRGVTYTLPASLPGGDAVLHCDASGNLTWV